VPRSPGGLTPVLVMEFTSFSTSYCTFWSLVSVPSHSNTVQYHAIPATPTPCPHHIHAHTPGRPYSFGRSLHGMSLVDPGVLGWTDQRPQPRPWAASASAGTGETWTMCFISPVGPGVQTGTGYLHAENMLPDTFPWRASPVSLPWRPSNPNPTQRGSQL
jgi:hypothetical protein